MAAVTFRGHLGFTIPLSTKVRRRRNGTDPERIINLTSKEFDILALLIANPKRVFTYELITDLVWKEDCDFYSRKAIHNHISKLRKKLRFEPDLPNYIESVAGIGYKFEHL